MAHIITRSFLATILLIVFPFPSFAISLEAHGNTVYLSSFKGFFISKNQGSSWTHQNTHGIGSIQETHFARNTLYAKTDHQILLSKDKGKSWNIIYTTEGSNILYSFFIDNHQLSIGCTDGIYQSTNNGKTWMKIEAPPIIPPARFLAVEGNDIYVGSDYAPSELSLWVRKDGKWDRLLLNSHPQGLYIHNNMLYVISGNVLLIKDGDLESWRVVKNISANAIFGQGRKVYLAAKNGLYISDDVGSSWEKIFTGKNLTEVSASKKNIYIADRNGYLFISNDSGKTWHNQDYALEIRSLDINLNGTLFAATNNGLRLHYPSKHSWQNAFVNQTVNLTTVNQYPSLSNQVYSAVEGQKLWVSNDNGQTWKLLHDFTKYHCYILSLYVYNQLIITGTEGYIFISHDGGVRWKKSAVPVHYASAIFGDGNTIIIGAYNQILISTDYGATWTTIDFGSESRDIKAIYAQKNTIYAGGIFNGLMRSTDVGKNWQILPATKSWGTITAIFKNRDNNTLYVVHDNQLSESQDDGATWNTKSSDTLSVESAITDHNNYYIGTIDSGLYFSPNRGRSWKHII